MKLIKVFFVSRRLLKDIFVFDEAVGWRVFKVWFGTARSQYVRSLGSSFFGGSFYCGRQAKIGFTAVGLAFESVACGSIVRI